MVVVGVNIDSTAGVVVVVVVAVVVNGSGDNEGDCAMGRPVLGFIIPLVVILLLLLLLLLLAAVVVGVAREAWIILVVRAEAATSTLPERGTRTTICWSNEPSTTHQVTSRGIHPSKFVANTAWESLRY